MSADGGPAFPTKIRHTLQGGVDGVATEWEELLPGMTIRDYFAGQALAGMVAGGVDFLDAVSARSLKSGQSQEEVVALAAYDLADAMLAAREATP